MPDCSVELGYAETVDNVNLLKSQYFPSKIGGKPAWLSFKPLPDSSTLKCQICKEPMCFLLQIYAPENLERAFHRTIFIFVCRNGACSEVNSSKNFVALRCQLPLHNEFYPSTPIKSVEEEEESKKVEQFSKLCSLCGCLGDKQCAKCKNVAYCDRSHQVLHWKMVHKNECCRMITDKSVEMTAGIKNDSMFPEFELVIESEVLADGEKSNEESPNEKSEEEKMKEYEAFLRENDLDEKSGVGKTNFDDLEAFETTDVDKVFKKFSKRIERNPEQVIRYDRGGSPLWATDFTPGNGIPDCSICGSPRIFEFQVMPHLLHHLNVDDIGKSLDWATVAVYTCAEACSIPNFGYSTEFVWKQDFSA